MSITPFKTKPDGLEKLRSAAQAMKDELPLQIEIAVTFAKIRREKFKAYVLEGFTPDQALELVKAEIR